jgi:hypothetical protein
MKKSIKLVFLALFFVFQNCSVIKTEETKFYITNLTGEDISNLNIEVKIGNSKKNIYQKIDLKNTVEDSFVLNKADLSNQDGGYKIYFTTKTLNKSQDFGYFSNGAEFNAEYRITIKKDTIDVKSKNKESY